MSRGLGQLPEWVGKTFGDESASAPFWHSGAAPSSSADHSRPLSQDAPREAPHVFVSRAFGAAARPKSLCTNDGRPCSDNDDGATDNRGAPMSDAARERRDAHNNSEQRGSMHAPYGQPLAVSCAGEVTRVVTFWASCPSADGSDYAVPLPSLRSNQADGTAVLTSMLPIAPDDIELVNVTVRLKPAACRRFVDMYTAHTAEMSAAYSPADGAGKRKHLPVDNGWHGGERRADTDDLSNNLSRAAPSPATPLRPECAVLFVGNKSPSGPDRAVLDTPRGGAVPPAVSPRKAQADSSHAWLTPPTPTHCRFSISVEEQPTVRGGSGRGYDTDDTSVLADGSLTSGAVLTPSGSLSGPSAPNEPAATSVYNLSYANFLWFWSCDSPPDPLCAADDNAFASTSGVTSPLTDLDLARVSALLFDSDTPISLASSERAAYPSDVGAVPDAHTINSVPRADLSTSGTAPLAPASVVPEQARACTPTWNGRDEAANAQADNPDRIEAPQPQQRPLSAFVWVDTSPHNQFSRFDARAAAVDQARVAHDDPVSTPSRRRRSHGSTSATAKRSGHPKVKEPCRFPSCKYTCNSGCSNAMCRTHCVSGTSDGTHGTCELLTHTEEAQRRDQYRRRGVAVGTDERAEPYGARHDQHEYDNHLRHLAARAQSRLSPSAQRVTPHDRPL